MVKRARKTPPVSKDEAKLRHDLVDSAIRNFTGQLDELKSAIGIYMIGRHFGWKVLHLIHKKGTIKKYETIIGIKVTDAFEPFGPDAESTNAFAALEAVTNFWKVVSGDEKIALTREERRSVG